MREMGLLAAAKVSDGNASSKKGRNEIEIGHPLELMGNSGRHNMGSGPSYGLPARNFSTEVPYRSNR